MDENIFGESLKAARKARGMTLKEVAKKLKISFDYVSRIEKGERSPSDIVRSAIDEFISSDPPTPTRDPIRQAIDDELNVMDKSQLVGTLKYCVSVTSNSDESREAERTKIFHKTKSRRRGPMNAAALARENKKRMEQYAADQKMKA